MERSYVFIPPNVFSLFTNFELHLIFFSYYYASLMENVNMCKWRKYPWQTAKLRKTLPRNPLNDENTLGKVYNCQTGKTQFKKNPKKSTFTRITCKIIRGVPHKQTPSFSLSLFYVLPKSKHSLLLYKYTQTQLFINIYIYMYTHTTI